jgi:hypothetical protein
LYWEIECLAFIINLETLPISKYKSKHNLKKAKQNKTKLLKIYVLVAHYVFRKVATDSKHWSESIYFIRICISFISVVEYDLTSVSICLLDSLEQRATLHSLHHWDKWNADSYKVNRFTSVFTIWITVNMSHVHVAIHWTRLLFAL